ncbi:FAD-linked sulfhydryl oxidase ERV1 isoform X2 [Amborella trichopoda]|uniref:FAD-linked sulfhydryl oxidase ERV1 isoform X2 n=1 Tax=Amborella trichopoda TaxID=13333 RepID=UPI0009BFBFBE|nr:FAD-linked sulfhydryl oxidase ERV1 isoform X2 [Amborella trichopoda]|eukprot:XP_020523937.1 FAD-linked sulfhydryl oxidase ERV1 isoform X2 [Amborella trichopoda]
MAKSPSDSFFQTVENLGQCLQSHLSNFLQRIDSHRKSDPSLSFNQEKLSSSSSATVADDPINLPPLLVKQSAKPSTKEEVGRATWTLLHTIAAQLPERPTKQQKRDVKELMAILSRIYPCKECADHFKEVLKANPVQAASQAEFSQWLCHVHNVVNRSLGKPAFLCNRVDARWGKLDCQDRACDLQGIDTFLDK